MKSALTGLIVILFIIPNVNINTLRSEQKQIVLLLVINNFQLLIL